MSGEARYAVYFAPEPSSPLARFGARWLGYDVATGEAPNQPTLVSVEPDRLRAVTAEARKYGFHATLKPPFALARGTDAEGLDAAVSSLAEGLPAFTAPRLRLNRVAGFWALTLTEPCPPLDKLAALCVSELDRFRAPPSPQEQARRRRAGLSPAQEEQLLRWGYPYVMEEFRFHMTLTARLCGTEAAALGAELAPLVEPFCRDRLPIDAIGLVRQERGDGEFRLVRRYALAG
jgi:putative phosphonate metabolism protein